MEIIKSDSEKMILGGSNENFLFILLICSVSLIIGAVTVAVCGTIILFIKDQASVSELNCQRTAQSSATKTVNCITREYRFWGLIPSPEQKIDQIRSAQLIGVDQVSLETVNKGTMPLRIRGSVSELYRFTNNFNNFAAGNQTSNLPSNFMFTYDGRRNLFFPFLILFLAWPMKVGISALLYNFSRYNSISDEEERIILDKGKQSLTWKLPNSHNSIECQLSQVKGVELHMTKIGDSREVFQVYLSVESRGLILIGENYYERNSANLHVKQLARFLDVPIERRSFNL